MKPDTIENQLRKIANTDPVDWKAFDNLLKSIEDINYIDEQQEET